MAHVGDSRAVLGPGLRMLGIRTGYMEHTCRSSQRVQDFNQLKHAEVFARWVASGWSES